MKGICLDKNKDDQNEGVLGSPITTKFSLEECLDWCKKQKLATGCEYQRGIEKCFVHTNDVSYASGEDGSVCTVIHPKGLFLSSRIISLKTIEGLIKAV